MAAGGSIDGSEDSNYQEAAANEYVNGGAGQGLDAEVTRFLASEFFTNADTTADSPSFSCHLSKPKKDDAVFTDLIQTLDMPDLELDGGSGPRSEDSAWLNEADDALSVHNSMDVTTTADLHPTSSLQVLIPLSALSTPPQVPNVSHLQRNLAKETAPPPAVPSTKKARKRVKDEIEYLRQQVTAFEEKLEKLRLAPREEQQQVAPQTDALSFRQGPFTSQLASWEGVAKHQADEKEKSQAENVKLKEKLSRQLHLARNLSKLLETQQAASVKNQWLETPPAGRAVKKLCIEPESSESLFEILSARAEELYIELDAVLDEASRVEPEHGVKSDANGNVHIEFHDTSVVPFDYCTTADAMWKLMSTTTMNFGNRQYQAISAADDTVRARLSMTLRLHRQDMRVDMSFCGKRFVEATRIVIVWCTMSETQGGFVLANGSERVQVRECGWTIMKAVHPQPGTVVQTIARLTPELEESEASAELSKHHVGLLTDVVLSLYQQNLAALLQMIENAILSDAAEVLSL